MICPDSLGLGEIGSNI